MENRRVNLIVTGVGGQGILALSRVIGEAAIREGYQVKIAEVHGMAQRGGSLVTHVKIGKEVKSPLIPKFKADMLISMEVFEAIRYLDYVKPRGHLVINEYKLTPTGTLTALGIKEMLSHLKSLSYELRVINAYEISLDIGEVRTANMVIFGYLIGSNLLPISKESAIKAMKIILPSKYLNVNVKAFDKGYKLGLGYKVEKNLS